MKIINMRKYYYPLYTKDTYIEVPDEVADAIVEGQREGRREDSRKHYYGVYSLDSSVGIENYAKFHVPSPEDLLIQAEDSAAEVAAEKLMLDHLEYALSCLTPNQARRLHARFMQKKKFREIGADEGITGSAANRSVSSAITKLRQIFTKNGWLKKKD